MQTFNIGLVYAALIALVLVIFVGACVVSTTPEKADLETRKLRFAAATFTGITMLFVFVSLLYFAGGTSGPGQQIFEKGFTAMFTLAGTIVGYLFGSNRSSQSTFLTHSNEMDAEHQNDNHELGNHHAPTSAASKQQDEIYKYPDTDPDKSPRLLINEVREALQNCRGDISRALPPLAALLGKR